MWRYVRLLEREYYNDSPPDSDKEELKVIDINVKFCKLRTIFGRNYKTSEAIKTCYIADRLGYIGIIRNDKGRKTDEIAITGEGFLITSFASLLELLAKSIISISAILLVLIAVLALIISIAAYNK